MTVRPWLVAGGSALAAALLCVLAATRHSPTQAWLKAQTANVFERADTLDEHRARILFGLERVGEQVRYDPVAWLTLQPNHEETTPWPEHADGALTLRSNDLGLRRDGPVPAAKTGPRLLVLGDSHTAGLVPNAESFASRLEARLAARPGGAGTLVLNAGVPYTGPRCHRQRLEKYLFLEPDVVIVVCFTGNDFWDELGAQYLLDGWTPPVGDEAYRARIEKTAARWPGPASQGFNQAFRFRHFPWEPARALELATESLRSMQARCTELGLRLLVVLLPTKMDVEPKDDAATQEAVRQALELTPEEAAVNRRLGARLANALRAAGIECLDPLDDMRAAPHPLYWRQDYHLATSGHAWLAERLEAVLLAPR